MLYEYTSPCSVTHTDCIGPYDHDHNSPLWYLSVIYKVLNNITELLFNIFSESSSGSSESLNSSQSNHLTNSMPTSAPDLQRKVTPNAYSSTGTPEYGNVNALGNNLC
jgi:hypothetical protein